MAAPMVAENTWSAMYNALEHELRTFLTPCLTYFDSHILGTQRFQYEYFLGARLLDAGTIKRRDATGDISLARIRRELQPIFEGREWPFTVDQLITEYPAYVEAVRQHTFSSGITTLAIKVRSVEIRKFWLQYQGSLSTWFQLYCVVAIISPSSACIERLFSFLRRVFGEMQEHAKQDGVELATVMQYNERAGENHV
jgi:hypothetical protein